MSAAPTTADTAGIATDRPSAFDDTALFGHPRGLGLLFITEMWERFSYYGMRGVLILYLTQALKWDTARAASLYGLYTSMVFLTPLIGGYIADRFIGTRRSLVIGGIIIALGHFSMALASMTSFYVGLVLICIGTGFFKPNVSTMVGQIYKEGDARRDAGFTIFYMGINTGAVLGGFVCGYLADPQRFGDRGWHWAFGAAGVGMVLGLIVYLMYRDKYLPGIGEMSTKSVRTTAPTTRPASSAAPVQPAPDVETDSKTMLHGVGGAVVGGLIGWVASGGSLVPIVMLSIIGAALAVSVLGTHNEERKRVIALFLVVVFVIVFWAAYEQAGSSLNLFAANNTNLLVGTFRVPPAWFQNVNPAVILMFAPTFAAVWAWLARIGREPSTAAKMTLGLMFLGTGFLFMIEGGRRADAGVLVSPFWLIAAYTFHTWGELCLSPVGLSYVTKVAPYKFASLLMGVWFLANSAANYVGGFIARYTPTPGQPPAEAASGFGGYIQSLSATNQGFYMIFVVMAFGAGALMFVCIPLLKKLTASVKA